MVESVTSAQALAGVQIGVMRRAMDLQAMMIARLLPSDPAGLAAPPVPEGGASGVTAAGDAYAFSAEAMRLAAG